MTFDEWFESVYGKPHEDDGLKVLLREAWDAAVEECAKVCISMYAKSPASRQTDFLLEAASRIRGLKDK